LPQHPRFIQFLADVLRLGTNGGTAVEQFAAPEFLAGLANALHRTFGAWVSSEQQTHDRDQVVALISDALQALHSGLNQRAATNHGQHLAPSLLFLVTFIHALLSATVGSPIAAAFTTLGKDTLASVAAQLATCSAPAAVELATLLSQL
jgi:hypothetical protein